MCALEVTHEHRLPDTHEHRKRTDLDLAAFARQTATNGPPNECAHSPPRGQCYLSAAASVAWFSFILAILQAFARVVLHRGGVKTSVTFGLGVGV